MDRQEGSDWIGAGTPCYVHGECCCQRRRLQFVPHVTGCTLHARSSCTAKSRTPEEEQLSRSPAATAVMASCIGVGADGNDKPSAPSSLVASSERTLWIDHDPQRELDGWRSCSVLEALDHAQGGRYQVQALR